jgi:hypothetical protein
MTIGTWPLSIVLVLFMPASGGVVGDPAPSSPQATLHVNVHSNGNTDNHESRALASEVSKSK